MQKVISNKIQLGKTFNSLHDFGGVPSINDEGTLENLITKVDKVQGFIKTTKGMETYLDIFLSFCLQQDKRNLLVTYQEKLTQVLNIQTKNNLNYY